MSRPSLKYPAGRARLEPIAVLGCAYIMTVGAIEVVRESGMQLYKGLSGGDKPQIDMTLPMYAILGIATLLKLFLYLYCIQLRAYSGAALALAEDHINDVASNLVAIATAAVATYRPETLWWADPMGGILISVYIVIAWSRITVNQIRKIIGETAPEDVLSQIRRIASSHYPSCRVAYLRAYHAGQRLQVDVEMESSNPGMNIREASRVALSLKKVLESIPEVESAAVVVVAHPSRILSSSVTGESEGGDALRPSQDSSFDEETGQAGSRRVSFNVPAESADERNGEESQRRVRESPSPRRDVPPQPGTGSFLGQLLWSRSLRDPPESSLRSARMVGYGTTASP